MSRDCRNRLKLNSHLRTTVCHPGETSAGDRLIDLLARIAAHTARLSQDAAPASSLVGADYLASMLVKLGAEPRAVDFPQDSLFAGAPKVSHEHNDHEDQDEFVEAPRKAQLHFSAAQRMPAIRRWCKVVQVLCLHGCVSCRSVTPKCPLMDVYFADGCCRTKTPLASLFSSSASPSTRTPP